MSDTTDKPCPTCTCTCTGTGEVVHLWDDGSGAVSACPNCYGTGRVGDDDTVEIVVVERKTTQQGCES